ncbi:SRPBCC family protein [Micromonospora zhanjiangensis]|uniref:SRPBCC family protein n=1 Tax=Micromonospora zhanjiangensis TaxID=1522057 RepID=A0ABV8KS75_9ACTN
MTGRLRAWCTRAVSTTVDIDRPAAEVWAVLIDFGGYPEWNPQIRRAEGELVPGRRVTFHMHPPIGPPIRIRPRVLIVDPGHELRLRGSLPGVFGGEHWFTLEPIDDGYGTHVTQGETYRGLIVPLLGRVIAASLISFQRHNAALKRRVETISTDRQREPS